MNRKNQPILVVTRLGYCSCGVLTSITNACTNTTLTNITYFAYDSQSRLTQIQFADGSVVNRTLDALGRVKTVDDSVNSFNRYFDNLNRLTSVTGAYGALWQEAYDVGDRTIQTTDANNVTLNNTFDGLNRPTARVWAADHGWLIRE